MWGTSKRKISCKCISTYKFVGHESSNKTFSLFRTILLSFWNFECLRRELMFLWNDYQPFPMLIYEWNTDINLSFWCLDFFLGVISWKGLHFLHFFLNLLPFYYDSSKWTPPSPPYLLEDYLEISTPLDHPPLLNS